MASKAGSPPACPTCGQHTITRGAEPHRGAERVARERASFVCGNAECTRFAGLEAETFQEGGGDRRCGVIVTAAGPNMKSLMHELALPGFRSFAERWRYDVRAVELDVDGCRADAPAQRAKWAKVDLMRRALREWPLALWLDADVLVVRDDEDIASHLHPEHFQALALSMCPPSTGSTRTPESG